MKTRVLYISGLGDKYDNVRRFLLQFWGLWGVKAELVPMTWNDGRDLAEKLSRVEAAVDAAEKRGERCVAVGESAGGSIALVAASRFKAIQAVVTLCGVAQPTAPVAAHLRRKHPALDEAVKELSLIRIPSSTRLESVRSLYDPVVGKRHSIATGAKRHVVWTIGHLTTILACLTVLSVYIISLLRPKTRT